MPEEKKEEKGDSPLFWQKGTVPFFDESASLIDYLFKGKRDASTSGLLCFLLN